jgi:hypothetical protein
MKRLIVTIFASIALIASVDAFSAAGCAKCPPPPCCVKTVEVQVPAKKIVECDCHWVCPTECETKQSDYRLNGNY